MQTHSMANGEGLGSPKPTLNAFVFVFGADTHSMANGEGLGSLNRR